MSWRRATWSCTIPRRTPRRTKGSRRRTWAWKLALPIWHVGRGTVRGGEGLLPRLLAESGRHRRVGSEGEGLLEAALDAARLREIPARVADHHRLGAGGQGDGPELTRLDAPPPAGAQPPVQGDGAVLGPHEEDVPRAGSDAGVALAQLAGDVVDAAYGSNRAGGTKRVLGDQH